MRRKWEETPLAKLFNLRSEFHLLKQRATSVRTREAIQEKVQKKNIKEKY